jgi:hypothetical protein
MQQCCCNFVEGWITLHAGTFAPQYSEMTLGGGIDLTPENYHFLFVGGRINQAINANDANSSYVHNLYDL